jgi:hypothetical protein
MRICYIYEYYLRTTTVAAYTDRRPLSLAPSSSFPRCCVRKSVGVSAAQNVWGSRRSVHARARVVCASVVSAHRKGCGSR